MPVQHNFLVGRTLRNPETQKMQNRLKLTPAMQTQLATLRGHRSTQGFLKEETARIISGRVGR